jgi:hypothetical protein
MFTKVQREGASLSFRNSDEFRDLVRISRNVGFFRSACRPSTKSEIWELRSIRVAKFVRISRNRNRVFLASKSDARDYDGFKRDLNRSLQVLGPITCKVTTRQSMREPELQL